MDNSSRQCAFCGSPMAKSTGMGRTKEHGFARWLLSEFAENGLVRHTVSGGRDQPVKREWTKKELDAVTRKVCSSCNGGWMNDLEVAVRPVLASLIRGHGRTLYKDGQQRLAAWAVKTALAMELIVPDPEFRRPIDVRHYREMARCQNQPPPKTQVWLGAWGGQQMLHYWSKEIVVQGGGSKSVPAYSSSMTVGHAVIQVLGHSYPDDFEVTHQGWRAELSEKIWPYQGAVEWPPARPMDDDALWAFMRPFEEVPETRTIASRHRPNGWT